MAELTRRATLAETASITGTGVRFGGEVELTLQPAEIGSGLTIARNDLGANWPLDLAHSKPGPGCTISGEGDAGVHFVEHILAALVGCGVSDCRIELNGPEVPLLDGSALPLVTAIAAAGVARSDAPWEPIVVAEPALIAQDGAALCALPGEAEFTYALSFDHHLMGSEMATFLPASGDFAADLAPARTFITAEDAELAKNVGLLAAGSEENSVVVYADHISEEPALPQSFARHKLLDLIGDLFLLGRPVVGRVMAFYTGHRQNHELARLLAAQADRND